MAKQAVILIDHGSSSGDGAGLERLASIVAARAGLATYTAHMTAAPPTLAEAVASAADSGAETVIVMPCLLGSGRHVGETIPRLVARAAAEHPGVAIHLTEAVGFDAALADPIVARIRPHIVRQDRR